MPLLAFIQATTSARLPLHFHCTPDLLRYGRPREAANRSVTERPTALDVSCSAVYARPCFENRSLSLRFGETTPPPLPLAILTFCLGYFVLSFFLLFFFSLSLSLSLFFLFIRTFTQKYFHFFVLYHRRVYEFVGEFVRLGNVGSQERLRLVAIIESSRVKTTF